MPIPTQTPRSANMSTTEPAITSASEWKTGKQGSVIELPSGKHARVKRTMSLMTMLKTGKIPNPLNAVFQEMISSGKASPDAAKLDEGTLKELLKLADETVLKAMVEPRVEQKPEDWDDKHPDEQWQPSEDAIDINDMDIEDRMYVFQFAQGAAADLATFRAESVNAFSHVSDGASVQHESSEPTGD